MATVSDSSLLTAAQDIVTEFMDSKASLNDGVIKKASELGLNTDQTQRLIERTNTEAFLRVYPNDTEFEVASPEVILGIKTASITPTMEVPVAEEGMFKAASKQEEHFLRKAASTVPSRYQAKLDKVDPLEIFGMDEDFFKQASATKYESAIDPQNMMFCREICDSQKTASILEQENLAREMAFDDAIDDLAETIKQAALQDTTSLADSEAMLLNEFPDHYGLTRGLYDAITTKLACDGVHPDKLIRAEGPGVALSTMDEYAMKTASISDIVDKYQLVVAILGA